MTVPQPAALPGHDHRSQRHHRLRAAQRSSDDRMLFGVAKGIAEAWQVPAVVVRVAFIVLALNGVGIVLYALGVVFIPPSPDSAGTSPTLERAVAGILRHQRLVGGICVLAGLALGLLPLHWLGAGLLWPLAVVAGGLVVVWSGAGEADRDRWRERASRLPTITPAGPGRWWSLAVRLLVGAALITVGLAVLVGRANNLGSLGQMLLAFLIAVAGLAVAVGPWARRLWRALSEERLARVRSEERAEMAAHLHDSVLQTLALVQRNPATPREVAALARRQERDLRSWLYPERARPPESLAAALAEAMAGVEDVYGVSVHLVVVGDASVDVGGQALVRAAREAAANAAVHAGVTEISVYAEASGGVIEVFVRDRGKGFDPAAVPADRRGIAESIVGRMRRHGGTAEVNSVPGEGTEVVLGLRR